MHDAEIESAHVVRSISQSYELDQSPDYQNMFCPYVYIEGLCSLNLVTVVFWYFWSLNGLKGLKMGLKCLDLVWFGLAWPVCDPRSRLNPNFFFKLSKIAQLKV